MLVLSREIGDSIRIEDVKLTLVRIDEQQPPYVEIVLAKTLGGKRRVVTLPQDEWIEICYGVTIGLVATSKRKARLGLEYPTGVDLRRSELA